MIADIHIQHTLDADYLKKLVKYIQKNKRSAKEVVSFIGVSKFTKDYNGEIDMVSKLVNVETIKASINGKFVSITFDSVKNLNANALMRSIGGFKKAALNDGGVVEFFSNLDTAKSSCRIVTTLSKTESEKDIQIFRILIDCEYE